MISKKAQFLLLSAAMLIIGMFAIFQFFESSAENSNLLFQPSYSEDAINLFKAINDNNIELINNWYNFLNYSARKEIITATSINSSFTINVSCTNVTVTSSNNSLKTITKSPSGDNCDISMNNTALGDYIYFKLTPNVEITNEINITLGLLDSPVFYEGSELKSKLCKHASEIYKERQIDLNCTVTLSTG